MCHDLAQAKPTTFLLLTCEHAGRDVPEAYRHLFTQASHVLDSHRGYDIGALGVAMGMASRFSAPLIFTTTTRLLVECNRSPDHHELLSEFTDVLSQEEKCKLLAAYYTPHRASVERTVGAAVHAGMRVLHVGVHSFTDVLHGEVRDFDIGLLFDPMRHDEALLCQAWLESLSRERSGSRIRLNEPYLGTDDGLITTLRTRFSGDNYFGVEVEIRQGLILHPDKQQAMGDDLAATLASAVTSSHSG